MLALDDVTTNDAGAYSVVLSNATGTAVAGPAQLSVNPTALNPALEAEGAAANAFAFTLAGEHGRYYRILASTNLSAWGPQNFPATLPPLIYPPGAIQHRSVIFQSSDTQSLSVLKNFNAGFVRAALYSAPNEVCNNHLKQIRFAKQLWARSRAHSREDWVAMTDLVPFCADIGSFKCPVGGQFFAESYWIGDLWADPACKKVSAVHILEEPK
jgi:hypothetical protein